MMRFFRTLQSVTRQLFNLEPARFSDLLAARGHYGTRRYHRHNLEFSGAGLLEFGNHHLPLINLSAGGIAVIADNHLFTNLFQSGSRFRARLALLGMSQILTFSVAYLRPEGVGLRIESADAEGERFLKEALVFLDAGLVLQTLKKLEVPKFYQSPNWHSYGLNTGEFAIHLNITLQGVLLEAHVFYRQGFRREFVIFGSQGITVSVSPKRSLSVADKKRILRNGLLMILGLRQVSQSDRFDRLIKSGITRLLK
jgi:hypothetical protein